MCFFHWFSSYFRPSIRIVIISYFAIISIFFIPISLQPDGVNLWYFKLWLFDLFELSNCLKEIGIRKSEFVRRLNSFKIKTWCLPEYFCSWIYTILPHETTATSLHVPITVYQFRDRCSSDNIAVIKIPKLDTLDYAFIVGFYQF